MPATKERVKSQDKGLQKDLAATYNEFKEFEGKKYTDMKVGRGHNWHYDPGIWKETKVTPDKWEFTFAVNKRRSGKAPEGSGVPVGTEYHWYILTHQNVRKLDANTYTTAMAGLKYKLAHKRADKGTWSSSDRAQRRRLAQILEEMAVELRQDSEPAASKTAARPRRQPRHRRRSTSRSTTSPRSSKRLVRSSR